jgi:hypothetical protein
VPGLGPFRRVALLVVILCVLAALAGTLTGTAWAAGYWNVWQGNLPGSDGQRAQHSAYGGSGVWKIRLSWDSSSNHDMNFSWISNNGSWYNVSAEGAGLEYSPPSFYDRKISYDDSLFSVGVAQAGCENPAGDSTVYTNCRNATSL